MRCNAAFGWTAYRQLVLVAQSRGAPSASDWSEYISDVGVLRPGGVLVTGDGKLTPAQRADIERWQKRAGFKCALVTGSAVSRGVATALSWFGVPVKAFGPRDLVSALEFLELAPEHHREAAEMVARLQSAVASRLPSRSATGG